MNYLCYMLQGRAGHLTSFLELMLTPFSPAMNAQSNVVTEEMLSSTFMAWKMRPAFHKLRIELESLSERQDDWQLHSQAEGLLWCHAMLNYNTDQSTMSDNVREAMKRFNTIPFTSSVETYLKSWRPCCRFNYNFNEPLL
jgi:hypothetical protein